MSRLVVLLVDGEGGLRETLRAELVRADCDVVEAVDPGKAT